ncbi:hypothetical protein NFI96_004665 [Prochilodus magdalenae]|nr:hypothetical protein NFI96_004665 [Prochilodus magdalenae]
MLQRNGSQLLLLIALCSFFYSRTFSLPYSSMRAARHADGLFTSGYSKLLGQLSARRYLESLIGKRVSDDLMEDQEPVKRHSDAIFTDNYSRFRKQMAVKKYLNSVLTGKRSLEDPPSEQEESTGGETTYRESYDDLTVDEFLNHIPLLKLHLKCHYKLYIVHRAASTRDGQKKNRQRRGGISVFVSDESNVSHQITHLQGSEGEREEKQNQCGSDDD